jgi:CubicO group peptidase (beta-lactamase class C family)
VEVLSGMPLDQFLKQRIFDPLGMEDTFFEVPDDKEYRFAANYSYNKRKKQMELIDAPHTSKFVKKVTFFSGGGGLVSTTEDYWRFCQMMVNDGLFNGQRLLGRKTVELMRSDHMPTALAEHDPHSAWTFASLKMPPPSRHLAQKESIFGVGQRAHYFGSILKKISLW